jgi:hypothetical protein
MKICELRIKNIVQSNGRYVIVENIMPYGINYSPQEEDVEYASENIEGIKLTEDVLLKCEGVVKGEYSFRIKNIIIEYLFGTWDIRMFIGGEDSLFIKPICSLHELQNFYFYVYKSELKVNL